MADYANPKVLVTTDWVQEHLNDPKIRLVEVDVDTKAFDAGHIPGAVGFNWQTQLQDQLRRDIITKDNFEKLIGSAGIKRDDTVVLYGDNNNWFAAYAFWLFKIYTHEDVRLMNGGRAKWLAEEQRPLTVEATKVTPVEYKVDQVNTDLRAQVGEVLEGIRSGVKLIDVRSPDEFSGKVIAPPGMNETAQRGGHIPSAASVPWATAVNQDGTFKSADELREIYFKKAGVQPDKPVIAYCRIGERSSHSWFVLKYLLGVEQVKNYDGSWTEYGNLVGVPIER
ncbi:MAG: sulfurtransferase [Phycisphaeraceae bacterium]|nr:MAG: sulfurtransferase [Phycisphaeraceae bacterium]